MSEEKKNINIPEKGTLVLDESTNTYKLGDGKNTVDNLPEPKVLNE